MIILKNLKREMVKRSNQARVYGKTKYFGIGLNKTGTTSLKTAMKDLGFIVGNQRVAKKQIENWAVRDFSGIINFCTTGNFFEDEPFSLPYTYIALDNAYPNSKFILTIRDNPEQWYNSVTKYIAAKWGTKGEIPDKEVLQNAEYIRKGWLWDILVLKREIDPENPFNKESMFKFYEGHISTVKDFFRHRPDDLLVLNVAETGSHKKLCNFLGIETKQEDFKWTNKTSKF